MMMAVAAAGVAEGGIAAAEPAVIATAEFSSCSVCLCHFSDAPATNIKHFGRHLLRFAGEFDRLRKRNTIDRFAQPRHNVIKSAFSIACPQARCRCERDEIRAAEIVILAIELERETVMLEIRKNAGRYAVVEWRHPYTPKLLFAGRGNFEKSQIFEMHVPVGDQPCKQRA